MPLLTISAALFAVTSPNMALLDELQHKAFNFFWNESNPATGFTKDRSANLKNSDTFTVASCASTGFALAAYTIGTERKWAAREEALKRTRNTLHHMLEQHEQYKGWFVHFTNWETGKREWKSEFSSIDTSIFLGGMLIADSYWKDKEISDLSAKILKRIDWKAMMTDEGKKPDELTLSMGYHPESGYIDGRWNGFDEYKMIYIQAFGADPNLPTGGWEKVTKKMGTFDGIEFIVGGPLFMHQMSESFYSFSNMRDRQGYNYWVETRNATLANRAYCIKNPKNFKDYGSNFWGLSACDGPDGYNAFGAPGWINDNGTITPTSPIASMPFTPKESMEFAEAMRKNHPEAWGRYGFSNGINPDRDWVGPDVIGIDLGMMLLGVENYRTGMPNRLSMKHPVIQLGFKRAGLKVVNGSNSGAILSPRQ